MTAMEMIGVETRLVHLFLARRMVGQLYAPKAMAELTERYHFARFPTKLEDMAEPPIRLGHGLFKDTAIEQVDIYLDGLGVSAKSPSDILDAFVLDMLGWSKDTLGLDRVETHTVSKIYESQLVFRTNKKIFNVLAGMDRAAQMVSSALKKASNMDADFHSAGITLSADPSMIAGFKPVAFKIDRHPSLEFAQNIFLSQAPLPTDAHWSILKYISESG
jgi:hypothetical protein